MSDGMYSFRNKENTIQGEVTIKNGQFQGENDTYKYSGEFKITSNQLKGYIKIENIKTKQIEKEPLLATICDDAHFNLETRINSVRITLELHKARLLPSYP